MRAIQETLQNLDQELEFYNGLTEEQATELYNVDYKAEALQYILDWWGAN